MKIYVYHSLTGEYLGEKSARLDPRETKKQGEDVFLIPANATETAPPNAKKTEVAVFSVNSWEIKADFRGTVYYDENGKGHKITDIGVGIPLGTTATPPPVSFKEPFWDGNKWVDNYVEPDPDSLPVKITVGALKKLKTARTADEFVSIFKAEVKE